ncbi:MAG TPA: hypothetical protein VJ912_00665, partial [Candidatus Nanoarchaeia archaeon]|nr:hypothetical protein [Candidatus Nanoarchaeia archaeon]
KRLRKNLLEGKNLLPKREKQLKRRRGNKMTVYQAYNGRIKAWVKYHFVKGGRAEILNVKQKEPKKPFKGIPKKGKKK